MSELLKELCRLYDFISDLFKKEKNPGIKKGILELLVMVSDKIRPISKYKNLKIENALLPMLIDHIKETEKLINDYNQNNKAYTDLLDHVINIVNELEALIIVIKSPNISDKIFDRQSEFVA